MGVAKKTFRRSNTNTYRGLVALSTARGNFTNIVANHDIY